MFLNICSVSTTTDFKVTTFLHLKLIDITSHGVTFNVAALDFPVYVYIQNSIVY